MDIISKTTAVKSDICRLCLQNGEFQSIFQPSNSIHYAEKVMSCTSVKVFPNDNLPSVICLPCVANLNNAYSFKQRCEESDVKLRYHISNSSANLSQYIQSSEQKLNEDREIVKDEKLFIKNEEIKVEDDEFSESVLYLDDSFVDQLEEEDRPLSNILKQKCSRKLKKKTTTRAKRNNRITSDAFSLNTNNDKLELVISKKAKKLKKLPGYNDAPNVESQREDSTFKKARKKTKEKQTFECDICSNVSVSKSALLMHMRIHTGERPCECSVCGKTFSTASNLERHLLSHSDVRPHFCHVCGRTFTMRSSLRTHMRTHTGEKPFA